MCFLVLRLRPKVMALVLTFGVLLGIIFIKTEPAAKEVFYIGMTTPSVIIDPGHGGLDGGASSDSGLTEAPLNLDISLRLRDLLAFMGVHAVMTRSDEHSLDYIEGNTIRQNKSADLNARLAISRNNPTCPFLSIHLNKYSQPEYHGAQVFYSVNHEGSAALARLLQNRLRSGLDPGNDRSPRIAPESVYLMKHISAPAVTIECGFLSNTAETALLNTAAYRLKIAASICCGYIDYLKESDF